ncbi:MAG TPA: FtsX-like permease family protein [Chitinophagales bacterium]|nr:FtsX-like permease family protein [Chitinophagales bacterium]
MNIELFISRRLAFNSKQSFSRFIIRVAMIAVALSVAVMIVAGAIVSGFQKEISEKVFGFWGHIVIRSYEQNSSYGEESVSSDQPFYPGLEKVKGVRHIQVFATKAGIIKTQNEIEGIVLRGIDSDFDWSFLQQYIVKGKKITTGDSVSQKKIIISQTTADRLNLKVGDDVLVYFVQEPMRYRKLQITGIYKTGLEEYDRMYALVDIGLIQRLNNWLPKEVGGFEVFINNVNDLDKMGNLINEEYVGQKLQARTLKQINPNLFDWLDLQNMNERVIIILMILVAVINMTTVLLIIILERTNMIGILKSLGGSNWMIRKIFLYHAAYITGFGLLLGNFLGIGLSLAQKYFHVIHLDEQSYYVSVVPVLINPLYVILINAGTLVVCLITLIIPSYLVSRISPVKAIRFE